MVSTTPKRRTTSPRRSAQRSLVAALLALVAYGCTAQISTTHTSAAEPDSAVTETNAKTVTAESDGLKVSIPVGSFPISLTPLVSIAVPKHAQSAVKDLSLILLSYQLQFVDANGNPVATPGTAGKIFTYTVKAPAGSNPEDLAVLLVDSVGQTTTLAGSDLSVTTDANGGSVITFQADGGTVYVYVTPISNLKDPPVTAPETPAPAPAPAPAPGTTTQLHSLTAHVTGLTGAETLVLKEMQFGGTQRWTLTATAATQTLSTTLGSGDAYDVQIDTQPASRLCNVTAGSGTITAATTIEISCVPRTYALNVTVTGLGASKSVTLREAGLGAAGDLTVTTNTTAAFGTQLNHGTAYSLAVQSQPAGQTCVIAAGATGTLTADATATVTCSNNAVGPYTLSVAVTGLGGGKSVVLRESTLGAGADLTFTANTTAAFGTQIAHNAAYSVAVHTQPVGQTCSVTSGSGTMTAPTAVSVSCANNTHALSVAVTGLGASKTVVLREATLGAGSDLTFTTNTTAAFGTQLTHGASYSVAVQTQPSGQTCSVTSGSGTITSPTAVSVSCSNNTYALSVAVTGLGASKSVVVREANLGASADLTFTTDTTAAFGTQLAHGASYSVAVQTQPSGQTCSVTSGSGTITTATTVSISCSNNSYTLSVAVTGLGASKSVVVREGGTLGSSADLTFTTNTTTAFGTQLTHGASYNVTVQTQPSGQTCSVTSGSGTMTSARTISVSCADSGGCTGYTAAGGCWHLADSAQSCNDKCSSVGMSYSALTLTFTGSAGLDNDCELLVSQFTGGSYSMGSGAGYCNEAIGCAIANNVGWRCASPATTGAAVSPFAEVQRVCACEASVPTAVAASVSFNDNDPDANEYGGPINIGKAADESDITHYVVYWGSNTTTKFSATPIATVPKTGSNVAAYLPSGTVKPAGAARILVYTTNASGEATSPRSSGLLSDNVGTTCSGYGGTQVGGHCWFPGLSGESCGDVCTRNGLQYSMATKIYAGGDGTLSQCDAVLNALGATNGMNILDHTADDYFGYSTGCGVSVPGSDPYRVLWDPMTSRDDASTHFARACACSPTASNSSGCYDVHDQIGSVCLTAPGRTAAHLWLGAEFGFDGQESGVTSKVSCDANNNYVYNNSTQGCSGTFYGHGETKTVCGVTMTFYVGLANCP